MTVRSQGQRAGSPVVRLAVEGALIGAMAGILVIHRASLDTVVLVAGVLVAVAAGTGSAVLLVGRRARPQVPPPVDETPVLGTGGQWWDRQPERRARPPAPAAGHVARPAVPELAGYLESAKVVQCPRCGAFRIDVEQVAGVFAFRCRVDDHTWQWEPGAGWPATVVLSRRRPEQE
jgi:hypothetical protein